MYEDIVNPDLKSIVAELVTLLTECDPETTEVALLRGKIQNHVKNILTFFEKISDEEGVLYKKNLEKVITICQKLSGEGFKNILPALHFRLCAVKNRILSTLLDKELSLIKSKIEVELLANL